MRTRRQQTNIPRLLRLSSLALVVAGLSLVSGCPTQSGRFEFGVIGDAPYVLEEEARVAAAIGEMNRSDLAFVVHVGDIQADPRVPYRGGVPTCTDASLLRRMELFGASIHPFILTPGDNDWTDCHLVKDRGVDPLERLARLRAVFFPSAESLGQKKFTLTVQATEPRYAKYVENRLWTKANVIFVTSTLSAATTIAAVRRRWTLSTPSETLRTSHGWSMRSSVHGATKRERSSS